MREDPSLAPVRALVSARLQKATVVPDLGLVLELYAHLGDEKGARRWLVVGGGAVTAQEKKPDLGAAQRTPPATQGLARKETVPAVLHDVIVTELEHRGGGAAADPSLAPALFELTLVRPEGSPRVLVVERTAEPRTVLCAQTEEGLRILGLLDGAARAGDGRDLRRGRLYERPRAAGTFRPTPKSAPALEATAQPATHNDDLASLRARLRAERKRLQRLHAALENDSARHGDAARHAEDGELLKTVLGRVRRGMSTIDVVDWAGDARTLPLDPVLDASGNLEALFKRARRAREAATRIAPRLEDVHERMRAIDALRASIAVAMPDDADVSRARALLDRPDTGGSPRRKAARAGKRQPWRAFRLSDVVTARVGRGARDNDALVKSARGNDLWLHARGHQGAHVVLPSSGQELDPQLVLDAAHLAAHFSSARGETHVDVQTARVKHLRKPGPGAPPGLVHVTHETVVHLRVDAERTQRLLAAEVPA